MTWIDRESGALRQGTHAALLCVAALTIGCMAPNPLYVDENQTGSSVSASTGSSDPSTTTTTTTTDPNTSTVSGSDTGPTSTSTTTDPPLTTESPPGAGHRLQLEIFNPVNDSVPGMTVLADLVDDDYLEYDLLHSEPNMYFTLDVDGQEMDLFHEVEVYEPDEEDLKIWVHVPLLKPGPNIVWMYYGHPPGVAQPPASSAWPEYEHVYHFAGSGTKNSVEPDGPQPIVNNGFSAGGAAGPGLQLNLGGSLELSNISAGTENMTGQISFAFRNDTPLFNQYATILHGAEGAKDLSAGVANFGGDAAFLAYDGDGDQFPEIFVATLLGEGNGEGWHHMTIKWNPLEFYVDGYFIPFMDQQQGGFFPFSDFFQLGASFNENEEQKNFVGAIDEVRFTDSPPPLIMSQGVHTTVLNPEDVVTTLMDETL